MLNICKALRIERMKNGASLTERHTESGSRVIPYDTAGFLKPNSEKLERTVKAFTGEKREFKKFNQSKRD